MRDRGAGSDLGDHPWGNRHEIRARSAVVNFKEKEMGGHAQEGWSGRDRLAREGTVGTGGRAR